MAQSISICCMLPFASYCLPYSAATFCTMPFVMASSPLLWSAVLCCQLPNARQCSYDALCCGQLPFAVGSYPLPAALCCDQLPFVNCPSACCPLPATLSGGQLTLQLPCACCQFTNISSSLCAAPFAVFYCLLHAALCEPHLPFCMLPFVNLICAFACCSL